jgi:hypothetical protein
MARKTGFIYNANIKIRKPSPLLKILKDGEWLMTGKIFTNRTEQKNLDNKPWKSRNAGLYKRLPVKLK